MLELAIELLNKGFKKTEYVNQNGTIFFSVDVMDKETVQKIHSEVTKGNWEYEDTESDYYMNLTNELVTFEVSEDFNKAQYCFSFKDSEEFEVFDIEGDINHYRRFIKLVGMLPDRVRKVKF